MFYVLFSCGISLVLFLGAFLHWRLAMAVPAAFSLPIMAALYNLSESPVWLQRMGKMENAKEAAAFYRLSLPEPPREETLSCNRKESETTSEENWMSSFRDLAQQGSDFWLNFAFLAFLSFLFGWCGFPILSFYAVEIFHLSGSPISASNTACITRYIFSPFTCENLCFQLYSRTLPVY